MLETALQRGLLVDAEIMRCLISKKRDDLSEFVGCGVFNGFRRVDDAGRSRVKLSENEVGNVGDRGDEIDRAGRDRAAWHSIEFSLLGILNDNEAAFFLDRAKPNAAIGAAPREDHADSQFTAGLGKRAKKKVEWQTGSMPFHWFRKPEQAISNCKRDARRNEIDMIRL